MKASNPFETAIKNFIDSEVIKDKELATAVLQEDKNLPDCCSYIMGQVKKLGVSAMTNDEVFSMAKKYYLTKNLKKPAPINGKVVVGGDADTVEKINKENPANPEVERPTITKEKAISKPKKSKEEKPADGNQLSLFDELFK